MKKFPFLWFGFFSVILLGKKSACEKFGEAAALVPAQLRI